MNCGIDHTWLGSGIAMAVAPIRPLAWEPPYALDVALKSKKKKKVLITRRSSCCNAKGSMASLEPRDAGSIPDLLSSTVAEAAGPICCWVAKNKQKSNYVW